MEAVQVIVDQETVPLPGPCPRPGRVPVLRDTLYATLGTMEVGGASVVVNRKHRSVQEYVRKFRIDIAPEANYVVRESRPGWTRIWRVR